MTQQEFSGDFTKMHVILRFKVTETVGQDALTTFVGHSHQSDHTRRQIRRYRGKIDDVVDVVTTDGYLIRMKPLIITERRCQTSVKQAIRSKTAELIRGFASKSNYSKVQESMLNGDLETEIRNAIKPIYPCKNVVIRKSQLLQSGVVTDKGPTLDEIHAEEEKQEAEIKARKAAALETATEEEDQNNLLAAAEAMESISEKEEVTEESSNDEVVEDVAESTEEVAETASESGESEADLMKLKKDELVAKAKEAGVATSGTKADIVARLLE